MKQSLFPKQTSVPPAQPWESFCKQEYIKDCELLRYNGNGSHPWAKNSINILSLQCLASQSGASENEQSFEQLLFVLFSQARILWVIFLTGSEFWVYFKWKYWCFLLLDFFLFLIHRIIIYHFHIFSTTTWEKLLW